MIVKALGFVNSLIDLYENRVKLESMQKAFFIGSIFLVVAGSIFPIEIEGVNFFASFDFYPYYRVLRSIFYVCFAGYILSILFCFISFIFADIISKMNKNIRFGDFINNVDIGGQEAIDSCKVRIYRLFRVLVQAMTIIFFISKEYATRLVLEFRMLINEHQVLFILFVFIAGIPSVVSAFTLIIELTKSILGYNNKYSRVI